MPRRDDRHTGAGETTAPSPCTWLPTLDYYEDPAQPDPTADDDRARRRACPPPAWLAVVVVILNHAGEPKGGAGLARLALGPPHQAEGEVASTACAASLAWMISTFRGLSCSATGMVIVSTPFS